MTVPPPPRTRIVVIPSHIRRAAMRAAEHIKKLNYDILFLNFSRQLEDGIRAIAEGVPYEYVVEKLRERRLILEPIGSWEYCAKPILMSLKGILTRKPNIKIYCYRDPFVSSLYTKVAEKVMLLIFRVCSTGRIDIEAWENLIKDFLESEGDAVKREADFIAKEMKKGEDGLCIAGFDGGYLKRRLEEGGCTVKLIYLFTPYHFTPLEVLVREMRMAFSRGLSVSRERIAELVRNHALFMREYVTTSRDYDEAYLRWMDEQAPWISFTSRTWRMSIFDEKT